MEPSLWSSLLDEILDLVVDQLVNTARSMRGSHYRSWHRTFKRQLSWLSFTTKRWARCCRPYLFERLVLKSPDDVLFLYHLLCSPLSGWLAPHIAAIQLELSTDKASQVVCSRFITSIIPTLQELTYTYTASYKETPCHFNSLSVLLRASRCAQHLRQFSLENYQFTSFPVLLRLLISMQKLESLTLRRITWTTPVDAVSDEHPTACQGAFRHLRNLRVESCTQLWPFTWVFGAAGCMYQYEWHRSDNHTTSDDISALSRLMHLLIEPLGEAGRSSLDYNRGAESRGVGKFIYLI